MLCGADDWGLSVRQEESAILLYHEESRGSDICVFAVAFGARISGTLLAAWPAVHPPGPRFLRRLSGGAWGGVAS